MNIVSSLTLAELLGVTAAQIRKDFSYFGGFGKQGTGYQIFFLVDVLQRILKIDRIWKVALVGLGDLGNALIRYQCFATHGFEIVLAFDNDPLKVGAHIGSVQTQHIDSLEAALESLDVKIALLTVSATEAQAVTDRLIAGGVKAILNYAPVTLTVPGDVQVLNVDPVHYLQQMTYYLAD